MTETVNSYCPICNAELHTYLLDAEEAAEFVTLRQRIAELESDAAVGALIRQLRPGHRLEHNHNKTDEPWAWSVYDDLRGPLAGGKNPEAALREALREQDDKQ